MNDPVTSPHSEELRSPRLDQLRFARRVTAQQARENLARLDRWIAEEERREAERRRGAEARPPVPDWMLEVGIGKDRHPVAVHAGGCHMAGHRVRPLTRDQAVRALTDGGVEACTHCRPDTELGVLD